MVGILLKIGKQSENVGEEEVFGRFCIRDVTENPSGGLLRRISALQKSGFAPRLKKNIFHKQTLSQPRNTILSSFFKIILGNTKKNRGIAHF